MLCLYHSLLPVYASKYLYAIYLNNMTYENIYMIRNLNNEPEESISNQFCSVLYCTYGYLLYKIPILNSYGRYENPVIRMIRNLNNEPKESIRNQFCSVMYLRVLSIQDLYSELLQEIGRIPLYVSSDKLCDIELCYT